MMEKVDIIELYKHVVIQIATPYSTGTGFYISDYDLIITNEHVIRDNNEVVVVGEDFEKQMVDVIYCDPKFDLAFLACPKFVKKPSVKLGLDNDLKEGDQVLAVGHPFGLKYTATQGIVSNTLHKQDDINYIQHDAALNPGNSGGPLLANDGKIVGVNTFIIRDGNNIGFSLPIRYLNDTLKEFSGGGGEACVRCNSCLNLVFESQNKSGYCIHCGAKMKMISGIEAYEPVGISFTLENILEKLDFDNDLARRGPNNWEIIQGSAKINISYHEKSGLIVGDGYLCSLPKKNIKPLYKFLLNENYKLDGLTFSVKGQDIILSLMIYDQYLNVESGIKLFRHLIDTADKYDDILVKEYGGRWKDKE